MKLVVILKMVVFEFILFYCILVEYVYYEGDGDCIIGDWCKCKMVEFILMLEEYGKNFLLDILMVSEVFEVVYCVD